MFKRHPDGKAIVERVTVRERVIRKGQEVIRSVDRLQEVVDNDLPEIAGAYERFRARYPEPGAER